MDQGIARHVSRHCYHRSLRYCSIPASHRRSHAWRVSGGCGCNPSHVRPDTRTCVCVPAFALRSYALVFYANNAVSSKSVTISVRNPVHKVEISTSVAKSVKVDSVPATINMPAITVAARDEGGYPVCVWLCVWLCMQYHALAFAHLRCLHCFVARCQVTGQAFKVYVSRVVETDSVVNNSKSFFVRMCAGVLCCSVL